MVQSKSLVKIAAALMITGTTCLVSVAATQTAHAQNSMSSGAPMAVAHAECHPAIRGSHSAGEDHPH